MRLNIVIIIIAGLLLLGGCEKEYEVYDNDLAAVRFMLDQGKDSMVYSFALHPGVEQDTLRLPVQVLGFTASRTRKVTIGVDAAKTTATVGEEFDLMDCFIPGDSIGAFQEVVIRKTAGLNKGDKWLRLKITDSPDLVAGPVNERHFRIILTNQLTKPSDWLTKFGEYSRVKHEFIIKITGKGTDYGEWNYQYQLLTYNIGLLNKALYEYNNAHPGHPMVDENGIPIAFPG